MSSENVKEIVVPKEQAVFRMDRFGRWHNEGGRFEHKKIIEYFNASIRRDEGGYFVGQTRGDVYEKVYFDYEDTPLFVVDAVVGDEITLILNTRETMPLATDRLFIRNDTLYLRRGDERIRFVDRVLLKLAGRIAFDDDRGYCLLTDKDRVPIPEQ